MGLEDNAHAGSANNVKNNFVFAIRLATCSSSFPVDTLVPDVAFLPHLLGQDLVSNGFATTPFPTFKEAWPSFLNELKLSAREQVTYMIFEDADATLLAADEFVKSEVKSCLLDVFSTFGSQVKNLALEEGTLDEAENGVLRCLLNLEWIVEILSKMDLMMEFVTGWIDVSESILNVLQKEMLDSSLWLLKLKLLEVVGKVFEAIGYGNVVIPAISRANFLKMWLPAIRKWKQLMDLESNKSELFLHKMDSDNAESIESAIVSLLLSLPSRLQAEILSDWLSTEQVMFPNLSEAFEIWCYRTKSAKRKLTASMRGSSCASQ